MSVVYPFDYRLKPDWAGMWERGIREAWANDMIIKHGSINKAWDNYAKEYEEGEIKYSNPVSYTHLTLPTTERV